MGKPEIPDGNIKWLASFRFWEASENMGCELTEAMQFFCSYSLFRWSG